MGSLSRYVIVVPCAVLVLANWNDASRGIDPDRMRPFPLTPIRAGLLREGQSARFDGLVAQDEGGEVIVRGRTVSGKSWVAHFGEAAFDRVYRNDLDGNGRQDYVVYGLFPFSNGRIAPSSFLTLLMMDPGGLPTPFATSVYDTHPEQGPRLLFDLRQDGRAQLLLSSYDEDMWDGRVEVFCSGHWIHQLLEPKGLRWAEFRGNVAGWTFPLVHRWSYWPKCPLESPRPIEDHVDMPERSTVDSKIIGARIVRAPESDLDAIGITPAQGCRDFYTDTVVYDHRTYREIALYNPVSVFKIELLQRIEKDRTPIRLYGVKYDGAEGCRANMLWGAR